MALVAVELRTERRSGSVVDDAHPELAWRLHGAGSAQAAYEIQVSSATSEGDDLVWATGRVEGSEPFGVRYGGSPLAPGSTFHWRVRVWDEGGDGPGPWSDPATFETGIPQHAWRASWITADPASGGMSTAPLYLRATADLSAPVVRGRAYVSALGWYRFLVNGVDLTGPSLVPRWTPFDQYVEYQVYDVTEAFQTGTNVLAVAVGDGRFRGSLGIFGHRAVYGDRLAAIVQVHLDLADGTTVVLTSDRSWSAGPGRITASDPKLGERADLRITDADWLTAEAAPARFRPAQVLHTHRTLIPEEAGRVQQVDLLPARAVTRSPSGTQLVDFGQNFAGVVRIRLAGTAGSTVRITHSEVLTPAGELDTDYLHMLPIGHWEQRDEVVLDGHDTWYQPWFTIHGFRYVEVDGLAGDLRPEDVEGVVLSSALEPSGEFDCSDPRLTQLHTNIGWSLRSNFVDTPTDCPTRERSGWTGDIQVFGATATTYVDAHAYLRRYLRNVAAEQLPDGRVPHVIPAETSRFTASALASVVARGQELLSARQAQSTGWGDVAVLLPWILYRYYGDLDVLERQYSSMTAWVDQLARRARENRPARARLRGRGRPEIDSYILDTGFNWGEWLRPGDSLASEIVDAFVRGSSAVATAYMEHSARTLSRIAELLDRSDDATRYRELADSTRAAWRSTFVRQDGLIGSDRQDDYVRALAFDLLEPEERPRALDRLVALIEQADDHLGTGFLSTPMLLSTLDDGGRADVAWRLLLQTTSPSWLYQVERGATTTWETWEGYRPDGRAVSSHNHYAFGTVARFLTERVAGLAPAEPGYRVIEVRPLIGGGLTSARASVQTPYGRAASSWRLDGDRVELAVTVPPGATAEVRLGDQLTRLTAGTHTLEHQRDEVGP
jgi:alpha-L-rhamnosidase